MLVTSVPARTLLRLFAIRASHLAYIRTNTPGDRMLRDLLIERGIGEKGGFRWRSHEVSRIEGLSDAVFGFAITLLVVSLDVPRDFSELANRMRGFLAFAISFAMLVWIWFEQHKYFRR